MKKFILPVLAVVLVFGLGFLGYWLYWQRNQRVGVKLGKQLRIKNSELRIKEKGEEKLSTGRDQSPGWLAPYLTPGPVYQDQSQKTLTMFNGRFQKFEPIQSSKDLYLVLSDNGQLDKFRLVIEPNSSSGIKFSTEISGLKPNPSSFNGLRDGIKVFGEADKLSKKQLDFLFSPGRQISVFPYLVQNQDSNAIANIKDKADIYYLRAVTVHEP